MISRLYESKNTTSEINMSNKKIRRIQIRFFINLLLDFIGTGTGGGGGGGGLVGRVSATLEELGSSGRRRLTLFLYVYFFGNGLIRFSDSGILI
jgi:hypothetical protein